MCPRAPGRSPRCARRARGAGPVTVTRGPVAGAGTNRPCAPTDAADSESDSPAAGRAARPAVPLRAPPVPGKAGSGGHERKRGPDPNSHAGRLTTAVRRARRERGGECRVCVTMRDPCSDPGVRFRIPQPWSGPIGYSSSELFVEIGSRGRRRVHSTPRARDHGRHATGVCARATDRYHTSSPHACVRTLSTSRWVPRWFSDAAVLQHVYIIL